MTAVEWLIENLMINGLIRLTKEEHGLYKKLTGLAKQMEKDQVEISDEEIEKFASDFYDNNGSEGIFIMGAKWYRKKLKNK